ncbi:MAG: hypothetical protein COA45_06355 [Zetaproteobacteria bacterium]|nr:MAG: hypothetical protein COA45_06355 [Zetaproteobacteria bacterium]
MADNDFKTLRPDGAVALWLQGKDVWNAWVEENPEYNIIFHGIDFSEYREHPTIPKGEWPFQRFNFPKGDVDFSEAVFDDGDVSFSYVKFGDGDVFFTEAQFGNGNVSFLGAQFGDGYVDFFKVTFSDGFVIFLETKFGDGATYFTHVQFGSGYVDFSRAQFGEGSAVFSSVTFGDGDVSFLGVKFVGDALFLGLKEVDKVKSFSFKGAVFNGPFDISSDETFPCLIDLTHTKTSHHVSLDGVKCTLLRKPKRRPRFFTDGDWATQMVANDPKDIVCARRLMELAEANKDHQAAQNFHVLEMQANREHSKCPIGYLWNTEFWYEKLSDYGRSISRPLDRLLDICIFYMAAYLGASYQILGHFNCLKSIIYSVAQMFAFIPSSRGARSKLGEALFRKTPPDLIYALTFSQSILALILLFLLGLGLRHRYRI